MPRFSIKRYLPRSLYGRAALILLVPIVTIQIVVSFAFIQRLYEDVSEQMTQNVSIEIGLLLQAVQNQDDLDALAEALEMEISLPAADVADRRRFYDLSGRGIRDTLAARFEGLSGVDFVEDRKGVTLALLTESGVMQVSFPRRRVSASNPHQLLVLMVTTGILMTVIAYLFLRNQLKPIRRLALAAEAFGKGRVENYSPGGAAEGRSAGNAFLNMRARIERQMEQRTLMLSGVSHDLRTPLTRLKLGLSMQPEDPEIEALQGDVSEMEQLITAFLDFARSDAIGDLEPSDAVSLVEDVIEKARRAGKIVEAGEFAQRGVLIEMRPLALRRALENLVNNAVRYGEKARVSVELLETAVRFRVEDNGPGIAPEQREQAMKPFARLDASRNQNEGSGVGLGLAIAADIARSHGGTLRLGESEIFGGLSAEIVLPR